MESVASKGWQHGSMEGSTSASIRLLVSISLMIALTNVAIAGLRKLSVNNCGSLTDSWAAPHFSNLRCIIDLNVGELASLMYADACETRRMASDMEDKVWLDNEFLERHSCCTMLIVSLACQVCDLKHGPRFALICSLFPFCR